MSKTGTWQRREVNHSRARPKTRTPNAFLADGRAFAVGCATHAQKKQSGFFGVVFGLTILFKDTLGDQP
jgi:hypothetical protein